MRWHDQPILTQSYLTSTTKDTMSLAIFLGTCAHYRRACMLLNSQTAAEVASGWPCSRRATSVMTASVPSLPTCSGAWRSGRMSLDICITVDDR